MQEDPGTDHPGRRLIVMKKTLLLSLLLAGAGASAGAGTGSAAFWGCEVEHPAAIAASVNDEIQMRIVWRSLEPCPI